jgi:lysophospholipase L1-like esterase
MIRIVSLVTACLLSVCGCNGKDGIAGSPARPSVIAPADKTALQLTAPGARSVFQRGARNTALVPVAGLANGASRVEARYVAAKDGAAGSWHTVGKVAAGKFAGSLNVPAGGWYRIEVRAKSWGFTVARASVEKVGVGEVFIVAGQSNSANHGGTRMTASSDLVSAWNGSGWVHAQDPMPIATGDGGSPWPVLGDLLAERFGVPVGILSMGVGATPVSAWLPNGGPCYSRLRDALAAAGPNGVRAILWHQGESDVSGGTTQEQYVSRLGSVIAQTRKDAGRNVTWMIAVVGYNNHREFAANEPGIRQAQKALCDGKTTFQGPTTDDLLGKEMRSDGIHLTQKGLREHAARWANELVKLIGGTGK